MEQEVINSTASLLLKTLDALDIPVLLVNSKEEVLSCNSAACNTLQYPEEYISGRSITDFVTVDRSIKEELFIHSFPSGSIVTAGGEKNTAASEALCRRKDGFVFIAEISGIPLQDDRKLVLIRDISGRKKLEQKASQRRKELSIFNTFANILTKHIPTDEIMQETVEMLAGIMEAEQAWIYLTDDRTGELYLKAGHCISGNFTNPGETLVNKVIASGRPLLVKNASVDPRITRKDTRIESIAGVPLSSKGIIMGVLGIASRDKSYFTSMDIQLLSTIGSQLGVAIENSRLIEQLQEKMGQIELINELSGIINSSLSIGTIFRMMVAEIKKLVDYSRASLLLYNEKEDNFLIFALDTEMKTLMKKGVRAPVEGTSAGWAVRNRRPWISDDLAETEFTLDRKLLGEGIRSTMSIPLVHDRVLGVFNLDSTEPSKYSEKDLAILLPVAKHISVALENALLFEEISKEKKEWEKTFNAITDMVWIEDGTQRILRANHTLLAKTGFSSFEIPGRRCWELLDAIGINQVECLCADTIRTKRPSFRELKGTGRSTFHFWAYPLLDEEGQLYAIVHYLKDVTGQKQLEQQLVRSEKLASLGTLVAGIAHEINNPLGIIAGYSEALIERASDKALRSLQEFEDFPEYLETIHNEIFRCKGILNSLLGFSRPSTGTFREIDINELIKEVILLVNHRAKKLRHNIELRLNRDLPKINADPGNLRQLFMNIIINSIYFTPSGGGITVSTEMGPRENGGEVRVSVSDTGSGIPNDIIGKIFDPFFTTKPVGEGTGLGLAICHKIVEAHSGTIDVESEFGRGTTFVIKLPSKEIHD
jgi:two-component system, NtrC family, sensor kinase